MSDKNAQKRINKVSKVFIKFANAISNTLILCGQENIFQSIRHEMYDLVSSMCLKHRMLTLI